MSLVNRMLQDLERRHASPAERQYLPDDIRPIPNRGWQIRSREVLLLGFVCVAVLGLSLWYFYGRQLTPISTAAQPAVSAPVPVPLPPQTVVAVAPVIQAPVVSVAPAQALSRLVPGRTNIPTPPARQQAANSALPPPAASLATLPKDSERSAVAPKQLLDVSPPTIEKQIRHTTPRERAETEYRKALALLNKKLTDEAYAALQAALREDPGHAAARQAMASLLVEQQRVDDAKTLLEDGLAQNPQQPGLAYLLARIQVERGDLKSAAEVMQKSLSSTSNADQHAYYAGVLHRLGRHKDAVGEYQLALRQSPQTGVWWMGLGLSLEADGRATDAREAFQRALSSGNLPAQLAEFVDKKLR